MRAIRFCVVMISVVTAACCLSYFANQKCTKKNKSEEHKILQTNVWRKDCSKKISTNKAPEWMLKQIESDFSSFAASGITSEMIDTVMRQSQPNWELIRFRIIDNHLSIVEHHSVTPIRLAWMTEALQALTEITHIPNIDFIMCLGDSIDGIEFAAPVFAFAKHQDSHAIVLIPDFEALSGQSVHLLHTVDQGNKKYPWNKKIAKAFWRGATTGTVISKENFLTLPRSQAVTCSLEHPSLIDARFTHLVQCNDSELVRERFSSYFSLPISVKNHMAYKYQLLIDGNTCAYSRAYWQLFSNCAILKQESPNIQWFYSLLKPYVHYIPVANDLIDLSEKVTWSKDHDKEIQKIISNAQRIAKENLNQSEVYYYLYLVLKKYAELQR